MRIGKQNINFNQDFKDGYQAAIDYINVNARMLSKRRQSFCRELIIELQAHLKYNEELHLNNDI